MFPFGDYVALPHREDDALVAQDVLLSQQLSPV